MVEALVLKAQRREETGTRSSRELRRHGMIPGIIYGHKKEPVSVQLNAHDLTLELQHHHRLVEVDLAGDKEKYLVKDVQYDHLGERVIHVDLTRVSLDERVKVIVPVELRGTPSGKAEGGVLKQLLTEIELECVVTAIPEQIRVKIGHLQVGETLTAGDLELPTGASLITAPDAPMASLHLMAEEAEEEAAPAEEGGPEPEVIAREKSEEESES